MKFSLTVFLAVASTFAAALPQPRSEVADIIKAEAPAFERRSNMGYYGGHRDKYGYKHKDNKKHGHWYKPNHYDQRYKTGYKHGKHHRKHHGHKHRHYHKRGDYQKSEDIDNWGVNQWKYGEGKWDNVKWDNHRWESGKWNKDRSWYRGGENKKGRYLDGKGWYDDDDWYDDDKDWRYKSWSKWDNDDKEFERGRYNSDDTYHRYG